jgi:hypothetical protein
LGLQVTGIPLALRQSMTVQEALVTILTPSRPIGQLVTLMITALVAGAFNMRAARNMARVVRRSLELKDTHSPLRD